MEDEIIDMARYLNEAELTRVIEKLEQLRKNIADRRELLRKLWQIQLDDE